MQLQQSRSILSKKLLETGKEAGTHAYRSSLQLQILKKESITMPPDRNQNKRKPSLTLPCNKH